MDVECGQFIGELLVALGVVDVLAQLGGLGGGNPAADVAPIAPNLMLVIGTNAPGGCPVRIRAFAPLFGECSGLHGGDGRDLVDKGLAVVLMR